MAKFILMGNSSRSQMFGAVIVSNKGSCIVIDGGMEADAEHLLELIQKEAGGQVKAWFFTHQHADHTGAFCKLFRSEEPVVVENIYHCFPSLSDLEQYGSKTITDNRIRKEMFRLFATRFENACSTLKAGETFCLDDVKVTILRVYNPEITADFENNSSVVIRLDGEKSNVLILGDLGRIAGEETMKLCSYEQLHTEYVQLAHHGQDGVSMDFYEFIRPINCIWTTPDWLWDNDWGEGFDTGPFKTVRTRQFLEELGCTKEHLVIKDGTQYFEF